VVRVLKGGASLAQKENQYWVLAKTVVSGGDSVDFLYKQTVIVGTGHFSSGRGNKGRSNQT